MIMIKNEIVNYDYISVRLKKNKAEEIITYYKKFQWQLIEQKNHKRYDDIVYMTFKRNHFIHNKDELQLLQVYLETEINQIGKLKKNKNAKSISLGISILTLGIILLAFGVLLELSSQFIYIIFGIIIIIIAITGLLYFVLKLKKIYNNEKTLYLKKINNCYENIKQIIKDLEMLL